MKMAKAIRQKAATAERVAVDTADTYVVNQMRTLAQAFRAQAEIIKKNKKKKKKMSFSIKAMCKHGELVHRRKTAEAASRRLGRCREPAAITSTSPRPKDGTTTHPSLQICLVRPPPSDRLRKLAHPIS